MKEKPLIETNPYLVKAVKDKKLKEIFEDFVKTSSAIEEED